MRVRIKKRLPRKARQAKDNVVPFSRVIEPDAAWSFYSCGEREALLLAMAEGVSLVELALDHGLKVQQLRDFKEFHAVRYHYYRKQLRRLSFLRQCFGLSPVVKRAMMALDGEAVCRDATHFFLHGKRVRVIDVIVAANRVLTAQGFAPLLYPGIDSAPCYLTGPGMVMR